MRIKANGNDSACFDDINEQLFTWGSFSRFHVYANGIKESDVAPRPLKL